MNYREALQYIHSISDYDRGFIANPFEGDEAAALGLKRTQLLLDQLDNPERQYPIIHVAGTKGKGSTCAFIDSIARNCGLHTGLYTTPHLHTFRERIAIDGAPISESEFAGEVETMAQIVDELNDHWQDIGAPTAFELVTAMVLYTFAQRGVDLGIVEVGLGGRLDATNVVTPRVATITPISFDHEAILGNTLPQIATEKAGIIKEQSPVVVGPQEHDAMAIIRDIASDRSCPLYESNCHWTVTYNKGAATLSGPWGDVSGVELGLKGEHQARNAGVALMTLWQFDPSLLSNLETIREGLERASWPGRFERVRDHPIVIVDGAHNVASIEVLVNTLREEFNDAAFTIIFGSYRDKDLDGMLASLERLSPFVIATKSDSPRAVQPDEIVNLARRLGLQSTSAPTAAEALDDAIRTAGPSTVIVATGSLSIAAAAREALGLATSDPL